jgi:hypothetical protein
MSPTRGTKYRTTKMKWWKSPDLSVSNEYQQLTRGGCINCGALREVLKSVTIYNSEALHKILSVSPYSDDRMEGCWAYEWKEGDPVCLARLKDDDPKVMQARNEIVRAREAIEDAEWRRSKERARQLRKIGKRRLP